MTRQIDRRTALGTGLALLAGGVAALAAPAPTPRVIKVIARKFVYVPSELHVKQGETVVLQFTTPEVPMGFSLPDFRIRADLVPGQVTSVQLTPDRAGTFTFLCDVFCGTGHEDMNGTLVVT
jgi:cytochrome c oxidase subunit 2